MKSYCHHHSIKRAHYPPWHFFCGVLSWCFAWYFLFAGCLHTSDLLLLTQRRCFWGKKTPREGAYRSQARFSDEKSWFLRKHKQILVDWGKMGRKSRKKKFSEWRRPIVENVPTSRGSILKLWTASQLPYNEKIQKFDFYRFFYY